MAKSISKKVVMTHPESRREMKIEEKIYATIKAAILQSLKGSTGKTFTELTGDVVKIIRKKMPGFKGSIPWYTISIRLDMETKGIIEKFTEKGVALKNN